HEWVWKKPGSMLTEQHVKGTVKFGGGNIMIWGCMTAQGVGYACRINGNMNAELYTRILEDEFLQSLEYYGTEVDKVIFQQDNTPHTAQNGLNTIVLRCWTGLHSHQIQIPLNICGNILNNGL